MGEETPTSLAILVYSICSISEKDAILRKLLKAGTCLPVFLDAALVAQAGGLLLVFNEVLGPQEIDPNGGGETLSKQGGFAGLARAPEKEGTFEDR